MLKFLVQIRVWQWTTAFFVVHLMVTSLLFALMQIVQCGLQMNHWSGIPSRLPLSVASEVVGTALTFLHLPLVAVEDWLPFRVPPPPILLWTVVGGDTLLQSVTAAVLLRSFFRPPRVFAVYRVTFVTRPATGLAFALAATHVICSVILYLMARAGGRVLSSTARDAFEVLHPMLGSNVFRPRGLAHAESLSWLILEAALWAVVTTGLIVLVQRSLFRRAADPAAVTGSLA